MTAVIRVFDQAANRGRRLGATPRAALMATEVKLPRLGQGMESGVIVRWLKAEGDAVSSGEPLYELDTDKVTQEVEAEVDGVLLQDRRRRGRGRRRLDRRRDRRRPDSRRRRAG